ncbi:MAG: hypothetical protein LBF81_00805 [Prevotellaceae bacterium]|nr:hypothetical protein [Prevotellaceae bacterium]
MENGSPLTPEGGTNDKGERTTKTMNKNYYNIKPLCSARNDGILTTYNATVIPTGAARHEPRSGGICHRTQGGAKQQVQNAADFSTPLRSARNDDTMESGEWRMENGEWRMGWRASRLTTYDLRLTTYD